MPNKCTDAVSIYQDLPNCPGQRSLPGLRLKAYAIARRDIVTYPSIPEAPTTLAEAATLEGDFVLAADKTFFFVGLVGNKGQLQVENQGEEGSKTFKNTATLVIPGTEEKVTGLINQMNNDEMIIVVQTRNGKFRVVGNESFPTILTLGQDTGQAETDANQTTVTAEVSDLVAAPFYVGKLLTSDGEIDCTTGKITTP